MPKESEKTIWLGGEKVKESQIPEIFNLGNVFEDYKKAVANLGKEEANIRFERLLRKQLITFIQEVVDQPLTPNFLYSLTQHSPGDIEVNDHDYPQNPNIVTRANPRTWYHLAEDAPIEKLYNASPFAKLFLDRYLLEYEQIKSLVEEHLAVDPILSLQHINQLSETTQPIEIQLANDKTVEGFVSNWYAMAMPKSRVHKGGSSYFNMYRIIGVPKDDNTFEYYVQKQGLLHKVSEKIQVKDLLNLDQLEKSFPKTEREIMMKIIQLHPSRNRTDPEEVITSIMEKYDRRLTGKTGKIEKAKKRQQDQKDAIEQSIKAILQIFEHESTLPETPSQLARLKAFFEGIGNPLYFAKDVPEKILVEKYHKTLALGKGRDAFISSLSAFIPSITRRAGGFFLCGSMSAGGLLKNGNSIHGFGGMKDTCMVCPKCNHLSTNPNTCSNCHYSRSMAHTPSKSRSHSPTRKHQSSHPANHSNQNDSPSFQLTPSSSVGLHHIFSSQNSSVGLNYLFENRT